MGNLKITESLNPRGLLDGIPPLESLSKDQTSIHYFDKLVSKTLGNDWSGHLKAKEIIVIQSSDISFEGDLPIDQIEDKVEGVFEEKLKEFAKHLREETALLLNRIVNEDEYVITEDDVNLIISPSNREVVMKKLFSLKPEQRELFWSKVTKENAHMKFLKQRFDKLFSKKLEDSYKKGEGPFKIFRGIRAVIKLQRLFRERLFRKQFTEPKKLMEFRSKQTLATMREEDLKMRFEKGGLLGVGYEGSVCSLKDKIDGKEKALKIAQRKPSETVFEAVKDIRDKELSMHVIRVYEKFNVRVPYLKWEDQILNNTIRIFSVESGSKNIVHRMGEFPKEEIETNLGILMERANGTMRNLKMTDAFEVQIWSIEELFKRKYGIIPLDTGAPNMFYKTVTEEDVFRGEHLMDYPYWKYKIDDYVFYVPRQDKLIMLGDFGMFSVIDESENYDTKGSEEINKRLSELFEKFGQLPEGITEDQVLDMTFEE